MSLIVLDPGLRTSVQDLGRPGWAALGVSPSGAADRTALRLGNRLLGNSEHCAGLECTMGGLVLQSDSAHWCAVTGALAEVTVAGRTVACGIPFFVESGATLTIGAPRQGLRSYLTVSGGLATPELLGSRSEDTLGRLVPQPIGPGVALPMGPSSWLPRVDHPHNSLLPDDELIVPITPGPRREWMTDEAWWTFLTEPFVVSPRLDRIGVRLEGPVLQRQITRELPSEGLIRGAVQLPPSGEPIVFLADHPTTGGYPVVAVVDDGATDLVAQAAPGQTVRFVESDARATVSGPR